MPERADPRGAVGRALGHLPRRRAARRPTTSTGRSAAWPPRPTPPPCARPARPGGRRGVQLRPAGAAGRAGRALAARTAPAAGRRRPPDRTCSWPWPGPSPPPPNPGWAADLLQAGWPAAPSRTGWSSTPTCAGCWCPTCPGWAGWTRPRSPPRSAGTASITGAEQAAGARAAQPTAAAKAEAWRLAVDRRTASPTPCRARSASASGYAVRTSCCCPTSSATSARRRTSPRSAGSGPTKGDSLRKNVLRLLFPWPADKQALLDRLDPWLADGVAVQLGAPGDRGAPRRRGPRAALPVGPMPAELSTETSSSSAPFDGAALLGFLGRRCIAGVEAYAVRAGVQSLHPHRRPAARPGGDRR